MSSRKSVRGLLQEAPAEDLSIGFRDVERRITRRRTRKAGARRVQIAAAAMTVAALCMLAFWPRGLTSHGGSQRVTLAKSSTEAKASSASARTTSAPMTLALNLGASVRQLGQSPNEHILALDEGTVALNLHDRADEAWTVHAGDTRVDATAADFELRREGGSLRVRVFRGAVLVSGTRVAGQNVWVKAGPEVVFGDDVEPPASGGLRAPSKVTKAPSITRRLETHQTSEDTHELSDEATQPEALPDPVGELLQQADVARLRGDVSAAKQALYEILNRPVQDRRAGMAAFILGKVQLETEGDPRSAARSFERALALGVPSALRTDARARLVEALTLSGDEDAARRAQDLYESSVPSRHHEPASASWDFR